MPNRNIVNLIRIICIVSIIECIVDYKKKVLRCAWTWNASHVFNIYDFIGYEDYLTLIAHMALDTFDGIIDRRSDYMT